MRLEFTFHQALFGYDSGHHLLSASLQLPPEVRHLLAVATDLSGSAPPDGFEASFTGLPLARTNYYAFFCTWLAPEMPRPGCVWSHVLLIELPDFAELVDLGRLRRCFRRPSLQDWNEYATPLYFGAEEEKPRGLPELMMSEAKKIVMALYTIPERPVVVTAKDAKTMEDLTFALWSQQWPRLRRNFRFSTGSFADRGRGIAGFDLQVSPEANRRAWQREREYSLLNTTSSSDLFDSSEAPCWVQIAVEDLVAPDSAGFRSFLRAYGTDVNDPRRAFARLGETYKRLMVDRSNDWMGTLRSVGEMFPDPTDAVHLKESLVNPQEFSDDEGSLQRGLATASFLLASPDSAPYQGVSLDISLLASPLWQSRRKEVLALLSQLVRQEERASGTVFTVAVARAVQPSDLRFIAEEQPELIRLFFAHRPSLAFEIETWQLPTDLQWRIYEVLDGLSLDSTEWVDIVAAMLLAGTNVAVREAVTKAGSGAIEGALRWLDYANTQGFLPSELWREALAKSAADRLEENEPLPPITFAFCSWFLSAELVRKILSASRQDVQRLGEQPIEMIPSSLRVHTAFLLTTLGLRTDDSAGMKLVARNFFTVHDALAFGNYSSESWLLLYPELPKLGMWKEWDRCKKLRRAVQQRLSKARGKVLAKTLLESATTGEHLALAHRILD